MKSIVHFAIVAGLLTSLSGCVIVGGEHGWDGENGGTSWKKKQVENNRKINDLTINGERSVVLEKMGVPEFSEAFIKGEDEVRILYYRTQHLKSDGETSKAETTPLVFVNDKLIGWGEATLSSVK